MPDLNSEENVFDSFRGNIGFPFLQITIDFGHRGFGAFEDSIYFLHSACFADSLSRLNIPVIGFDFDFSAKLHRLSIDGNPSHNRHVAVAFLTVPFKIEKDAECTFHIPNY